MTIHPLNPFNNSVVDHSWHECIQRGIKKIDSAYLASLCHSSSWLPGQDKVFNAFSIPIDKVQYVLLGESPYPRQESANGYAFWDEAVHDLWSPTGLNKKVNRATSLRNIIKMMLIANGALKPSETTQEKIAQLNKTHYVQTNEAFFNNFLHHGFLLLNATPVLQPGLPPQKDAKAWLPFIDEVLNTLLTQRPHIKMVLFGKIANAIDPLIAHHPAEKLYAEHPYNLSFITNAKVQAFFKDLNLLSTQIPPLSNDGLHKNAPSASDA